MRIGPDRANPSVARRTRNRRSSRISDDAAVLFLSISSIPLQHLRPDYSIVWIHLACREEIS